MKVTKPIPIMTGMEYQHVMGEVTVEEEPDLSRPQSSHVTITIKVSGPEARDISHFVASPDVVGLSFVGIPARPATPVKER